MEAITNSREILNITVANGEDKIRLITESADTLSKLVITKMDKREAIKTNREFFNELEENGDYKTMYNLAKELDANGNGEGTLLLSIMYHNGDIVKQNFKKEVKLLRKAVKMGSQQAKFNFALAFVTGKGVKQSTSKAISMMEQLADYGFEPAIDFLYEDEEECDRECCNGGCGAGNLVKCGESLDVVMARFNAYIKEGDFKTAFDLATELDDMDIENGTYALSIFYHNGQHVAQNYTREVSLLQKAASTGYEPAIFNLAMAMSLGKGIEQDAETGFEMIYDLVEDGYEPAIEMMVA